MKIETVFMDSHISPCEEIDVLVSNVGITPEIIKDPRNVFEHVNSGDDPVSKGKKTLYITENQGAVIRKCPGTSHYTCCDYTILHTGTFCTMDCSYCILQAYFHPPVLQYFVGLQGISDALDHVFSQDKIFRIGTGEFTDSLIWERLSCQPRFLVEKFARQNNSVLELKTKTVNIESLLDLDHNHKTIIAWSLNTPEIVRSEERFTASIDARLKAAKKCESKGYRLAFHFDPLILYDGCEGAYKKVITSIFDHVSPGNVLWISIGTFRFMPDLKKIIEKRFPDSKIPFGEFITGLDGKMRYFKPLRIELYQKIVSCIKEIAPQVPVYFCMEDQEVWEKTFGFFPGGEGELGHMLDRSAEIHCLGKA